MFLEVIAKVCRECGHEVVAACENGADALRVCIEQRPNLLVLDMGLPGLTGGEILEMLETRGALLKVLVVSCYVGHYLIDRLMRSPPVCGFVDKSTGSLSMFCEAITAVGEGTTWFSPAFRRAREAYGSDTKAFDKRLSDQEVTFLRHVVQELSDAEIAARMGISLRTAEGHRSKLLHKLECPNTVKLIGYARLQCFNLFPPPIMCNHG